MKFLLHISTKELISQRVRKKVVQMKSGCILKQFSKLETSAHLLCKSIFVITHDNLLLLILVRGKRGISGHVNSF